MSLNRPPSVIHYDRSGLIAAPVPGDDLQVVFPRNPKRIGMMFQNFGTHDMILVVKGARDGFPDTRLLVPPRGEWFYDQHGPINEVQVTGTSGEPFSACEFGD